MASKIVETGIFTVYVAYPGYAAAAFRALFPDKAHLSAFAYSWRTVVADRGAVRNHGSHDGDTVQLNVWKMVIGGRIFEITEQLHQRW